MTIEADARAYILASYENMVNKVVYSDGFPGDDHLAEPTQIGEPSDIEIGTVENSGGFLTIDYSFIVSSVLVHREGGGSENGTLRVSCELWGEERPAEADSSNPRGFRYDPSAVTVALV